MYDFSHFGGASDEWLAVQNSLPIATTTINPTTTTREGLHALQQLKATTNQGREIAAATDLARFAADIMMDDYEIPTRDNARLETRTYRSRHIASSEPLPIYIHLHGGGFLFGTLASEDATCARLASQLPVIVLNVNYRHTPEVRYPVAWQDVEDAVAWVSVHVNASKIGGDPDRVFIGGISAGGALTASVTLQQHMKTRIQNSKGRANSSSTTVLTATIKGQILLIPSLIHADCYGPQLSQMADKHRSSVEENKDAPILPRERIRMFSDLLGVENPDPSDLRLNPGYARAEDVVGMPPTFIVAAGLDPLRDEALLYGKLLAENGVPTRTYLLRGVPHGFRRFGDRLSASRKWDQLYEEAVKWLIGSEHQVADFDVHVL